MDYMMEHSKLDVPYFDDVVENGSKTRISNFFSPFKRSTILTNKY